MAKDTSSKEFYDDFDSDALFNEYKEYLKERAKADSHYRDQQRAGNMKSAKDFLEWYHNEEQSLQRKDHEAIDAIIQHSYEEQLKNLHSQRRYAEEAQLTLANNWGKLLSEQLNSALNSITNGFVSQVDSAISQYLNAEQSITAHLNGTESSFADLAADIRNIVGSTGLVKQEAMYNNLTTMIKSGITYNTEQRAFLQTLANDIDAVFNATDGTLTRLIRLQAEDMSANRLAIEYSLQEFLNQNYQTSEYIKDAFTSVSNSLLEMQSLMSVQSGMSAEATLQTWLGMMYSSGVSNNTVTSLANAINELGSGNVDNLGSGISNLLLMGINRAGLDYSQMINEGLTAQQIDTIMAGVVAYMGEINESSSNVVKSQWAKAFGVSVSDLQAINNVGTMSSGTLSVTTDIYDALLDNYGKLVPDVIEIRNILANLTYGVGTSIADDAVGYYAWEATKLLSSVVGDALSGVSYDFSKIAGGISVNIGSLIKAAPLLALLATGVGDLISGNFRLDTIWSAASMFEALGSGNLTDNNVRGAGRGTVVTTSGTDISQSGYIGTAGINDLLNGAMNSSAFTDATKAISGTESTYSTTDIYTLLDGNIGYISTAARQDKQYELTNEKLTTIANLTGDIFNLLERELYNITTALDRMGVNY